MSDYVEFLVADVKAKNPSEPEFHQAVEEVLQSLTVVINRHSEYRSMKILAPETSFGRRAGFYKAFTLQ